MISAFGVEHGETVSKLGPPQVHGRRVTVYSASKKDGETKVHSPTAMNVHDTGKKTLILRRPKYTFTASPKMKYSTKTHEYYAQSSGKLKPNKTGRDQIIAHVTSKDRYKEKSIGGLQTKLVKEK